MCLLPIGGGQVMRRIWRHNLATLKHLIESRT